MLHRVFMVMALLLVPVTAQATSVADAVALVARASLDPGWANDAGAQLGQAIDAGFSAIKAERDAALAAGQTPGFCIARGTAVQLTDEDIIALLEAVPQERWGQPLQAVLKQWMVARYPCGQGIRAQ